MKSVTLIILTTSIVVTAVSYVPDRASFAFGYVIGVFYLAVIMKAMK